MSKEKVDEKYIFENFKIWMHNLRKNKSRDAQLKKFIYKFYECGHDVIFSPLTRVQIVFFFLVISILMP